MQINNRTLWLIAYSLAFGVTGIATTQAVLNYMYPLGEFPRFASEQECTAIGASWSSFDGYCTGEQVQQAQTDYDRTIERYNERVQMAFLILGIAALALSRSLPHLKAINYGLIALALCTMISVGRLFSLFSVDILVEKSSLPITILASAALIALGWWEAKTQQ